MARTPLVPGLIAAVVLLAAALSGCSSTAGKPPTPTVRAAASTQSLSRALPGCGLTTVSPGVTIGNNGWLTLESQSGSKPTAIDRVDVLCVLSALRSPAVDRDLFTATSISGGLQTVEWGDYTAIWSFRDTLRFRVDIYLSN